MSDLPTQGLLQQAHARPISGEHLEVLGKQASTKWSSGECATLSDAVVETVKHAGLSPEQVKRVVEFANTDAYLREFKKEGQDHRFIDFGQTGPANISEVLKDLNDGGGGSVFDRGTVDYDSPPPETKTASSEYVERTFTEKFSAPDRPMVQHNPFAEVIDLKDKLAGAYEGLGAEIDTLELQYADVADQVYRGVKEAALSGTTLGEVLQAWASVAPNADFAKVAFQLFTPRLLREGVFHTSDELTDSLSKTASATAVVNEAHPMVLDFGMYCDTLQKLAECRAARTEIRGNLASITAFLKQASAAEAAGQVARKAVGAAHAGAKAGGKAVGKFMQGAGIPGAGIVEGAGGYVVPAVGGLAALEGYNHLKAHPATQSALALIPGTKEHQQHLMQLQMQGQGYY